MPLYNINFTHLKGAQGSQLIRLFLHWMSQFRILILIFSRVI